MVGSLPSVCLSFLPDDFPESTGVKRIVQALSANVWSSVEMKDGEMVSQYYFYIVSVMFI